MKFAKSLMAVALFASAGAASASINQGSTDLTREAYLSVYDSVQAKTFDLDLGITLADLIANVSNAAYTKSFDLSSYANWNAFAANLNAGSTVYSIAAARSSKTVITLANETVDFFSSTSAAIPTATAVNNHAGEINVGMGGIPAENLSKLVADTDTPLTGQYNNFNSIFGVVSAAQASIAYGSEAKFWFLNGAIETPFANVWKLSGNTLTLSAATPAAVPLPAAVWMFGAGLMGVLRLNRRKSVEA